MTILCRPRPRGWVWRLLKTCAAARPSLRAVSTVTGSTLAMPRTPSVPKSFLDLLISFLTLWGHRHVDLGRLHADKGDSGRHGHFDALAQAAGRLDSRQVHDHDDFLPCHCRDHFRPATDG